MGLDHARLDFALCFRMLRFTSSIFACVSVICRNWLYVYIWYNMCYPEHPRDRRLARHTVRTTFCTRSFFRFPRCARIPGRHLFSLSFFFLLVRKRERNRTLTIGFISQKSGESWEETIKLTDLSLWIAIKNSMFLEIACMI